MFMNKKIVKAYKAQVEDLKKQITALTNDKMTLKQQCEEMKLKKKLDEEDIKHMVKMKEEKLEMTFQKKVLEVEKIHDEKLMKTKDQYRDKMEERLEKETANIKSMYEDILARLPNVNVRLKGDV